MPQDSYKGTGSQLKQKLGQKLSVRQIQLMQMIELPITDLSHRIKQELERNPALEEGKEKLDSGVEEPTSDPDTMITQKEMELGDYADVDDVPDPLLRRYRADSTPGAEIPFSEEQTLQEHLKEQILLTPLDEKEMQVALYLIGSLDDDGYLRQTPEGLIDDLFIFQNLDVSHEELEKVEATIRTLDPIGVGARTLPQCLLLQLEQRSPSPEVELAKELVAHHFDAIAQKQLNKIQGAVGASDEELRAATLLISSLNPTPGLDYSTKLEDTLMTIIPDFEVRETDGDLSVTLFTAGIPEVRLSRSFEENMQEYTGDLRKLPPQEREAGKFVKQRLDEAKWFVEMIQQRNNTLMETMLAIVDYQRDYFLTGDVRNLRPMILKDIAERTGYDISTISRVTSTKYVQTDFGTFSLKHFFSEGTVRDDGEEVSTHHVKELLQSIIASENKQNPLSDEELSQKLKSHGYSVARRTVAKYRDQLNIPVARLRKEF